MLALRMLLSRKDCPGQIDFILNRHLFSFLCSENYQRWVFDQMSMEPWYPKTLPMMGKTSNEMQGLRSLPTFKNAFCDEGSCFDDSWLHVLAPCLDETCFLIASAKESRNFPILYATTKAKTLFPQTQDCLVGAACPFLSKAVCPNAKELSRLQYSLRQGLPVSSTTKSLSNSAPTQLGILLSKPLYDEEGNYSLVVFLYTEMVSAEKFAAIRNLMTLIPNILRSV